MVQDLGSGVEPENMGVADGMKAPTFLCFTLLNKAAKRAHPTPKTGEQKYAQEPTFKCTELP
jgi:hypothetical protein